MWRYAVAVIAVLGLLLPVASPSAASGPHKAPPKCPRVPARSPFATSHLSNLFFGNAQAEVYQAEEVPHIGPYNNRGVYSCVYDNGRSYHLGTAEVCGGGGPCFGVTPEALVGAIVAYEKHYVASHEPEDKWLVVVRNLRTGRILRRVPTGTPLHPGSTGVGPVKTLVLKPDGSVAWIAYDYERSLYPTATSEAEVPYYDVYAADKSGTRLLASGFDVSPSSLALAGSTLYWTQGGKPFSTSLN